jgi:phenylpropionate dioxygenase-like ring-hydroxylating dioxygenase large terminal subunit
MARGAGSAGTSTGWYPVARAAEVGTQPLPVGAGGQAFVVVRLRPGGEVSAFPPRCPHRLLPLAVGTVVGGRLECPAHGWRFDGEGRCVEIPSLGHEGTPPPRADLPAPWAVEERHGWVWVAPERTTVPFPPPPPANVAAEPPPPPPAPIGRVFGNLEPSLEHAWHPVGLSRDLRPGGWLQVRLLGRTWMLRRDGLEVSADPPAFGVRERYGLVWLAPAEPTDVPLDLPEAADRRFVTGWLPPERSPGPAGPVADSFLDLPHVPVMHSGAGDRPQIGGCDVDHQPGGFTGVREQWLDDPADPQALAGRLPLRRRCRATYVYRAPFQLRVRLQFLDSGAVTTTLFVLQPEDADSTRIYTRLLLSSGPGEPLPTPARVAAEVASAHRVLEGIRGRQLLMATTGLPLDRRAELHVRSDRLGVALRRVLGDFASSGQGHVAA